MPANNKFFHFSHPKLKHSPSLCCLLKTLPILLCIYSVAHVSASPDENELIQKYSQIREPVTNLSNTILFEPKYLVDGDVVPELVCPIHDCVKRKYNYKHNIIHSNNTRIDLSKLKQQIVNKTKITWLKNNQYLFRDNGNPVQVNDAKVMLIGVGPSDEGLYTCMFNYSLVPPEAATYFKLPESASFKLEIDDKSSLAPNNPPTISHPPGQMLKRRGDNATFTCNRIQTFSAQKTYWFKSCPHSIANSTNQQQCAQSFLQAYNSTESKKHKGHLREFMISQMHGDELTVTNITDRQLGYYGCLVENGMGIDIRLGWLDLIDNHVDLQQQFARQPASGRQLDDNHSNHDRGQEANQNHNHDDNDNQLGLVNNSTSKLAAGLASATPANVAASHDDAAPNASIISSTNVLISLILFFVSAILWASIIIIKRTSVLSTKKFDQSGLIAAANASLTSGCKGANIRQHLPNGDCPDIYNIGKASDGFISGQFNQDVGHLMTQSICSKILDKEKNPSISSSNSDEASSWGKSVSSHGDTSRAFYSHTSNTTTTTVPMYDHLPPSTCNTAPWRGAIVQNACVINPLYEFIRPDRDANQLAYPKRNLEKLDRIGEGEFGEVWRYIARQSDGSVSHVAVKQLRNRAGLGTRERMDMIAEIEIMKLVNNHPNVIKLLSYYANEFEPILIIMEYAENGKLQTYLRNCRKKTNLCRKSTFTVALSEPVHNHTSTLQLQKDDDSTSNAPVTPKDLVKFAYHIAKGMEYVAAQGIVHRDLASRNILVSKDKVCKVADFGFARRISEECAYERTTHNPVPIKWMAPEALVQNKVTFKSDIFSFGVLMWEIVTLGATPYDPLTSLEVYNKVISGGRLSRPQHCRDEFYNIMAKCWSHDPSLRPTFAEIAAQLDQLLLTETDYIQLDQYPENAYYNIQGCQ